MPDAVFILIVGYNSAPEAKFFVHVTEAFSQKNLRVGRTINLVRLLTVGPTWLALAPIFAATACMLLSIIRLVGIAKHGYGSSSIDASNGNLKPALVLFYVLVLTQGVLFLLWFAVSMNRSGLAADLGRQYMKHLDRPWRIQLMDRYVDSIADTCIQKGVYSTINTTLVSFAAELLLQSQDPGDHVSAVLVLHLLVVKNTQRSDRAVEQICSLETKFVYRLVRMLLSENLNSYIKANIAGILTKLACKLRLADMPGAAHLISSLLDSHLMVNAAQITHPNYDISCIDIHERAKIKPLFVHGLAILGELAADPENCTEIYNTTDLVPKIIAPVSNGLHIVINDNDTTKTVWESLRVLDKLTSGTGESSRKLCHELTTKYRRTAENILWILSNSSDEGVGMLAVKILSRLTLDEPRMLQFNVDLQRLLSDPEDIQLRIDAGKALIAPGDIQQLVTIMSTDAYSKEYRAVTAEMLAQICTRSRADEDRINRLGAVANALSMVLEDIVTETTDISELGMNNREFLASFLGLAVQIREKIVTAEAFADAVTGLPMGNNSFAETLKRIIEVTNDINEVCLAIMKSVTKLVTWMTEMDTISPGYYTEYFRQVHIVEKLEYYAVTAMVRLEKYVVMTGGADEKEGYATLQTLVKTAKDKLVPRRQQQS